MWFALVLGRLDSIKQAVWSSEVLDQLLLHLLYERSIQRQVPFLKDQILGT
jgi:hypothetical protein